MEKSHFLTSGERAKVIEIQDLLIDRYVEQKEAQEEGNKSRGIKLQFEIQELHREMEKIKGLTTA